MSRALERCSREQAAEHGVCWAAWPADRTTPVRLFLSLRARGRDPCLLESAAGPLHMARYSFLGVDSDSLLTSGASGVHVERRGEKKRVGPPGVRAMRDALASAATCLRPPSRLPPFCGGWVGWFGYEWASTLEAKVPKAPGGLWGGEDATLALFRSVVALDHAAQKVFVIRAAGPDEDFATAMATVDAVAADLWGDAESGTLSVSADPPSPNMARAAFIAGVERLLTEIRAGEILQGVLSHRFDLAYSGDPFTAYRGLRLENPSPHMFYFSHAGTTLLGSSPERLASVLGRQVESRPIAGTRPRGRSPEEDDRLAQELLADEKERAEHAMLVDLARNDVGRVAKPGSVAVGEWMAVERFSRVQHLVSRVDGRLAAGYDSLDALAAAFPAGTVTGAPKIRAMQLLAAMEPDVRGPYAGAFGYFDLAGNMDFAITIRTVVARGGVLSVQAGAGIVAASQPVREYEETIQKAEALFAGVRLASSGALGGTAE